MKIRKSSKANRSAGAGRLANLPRLAEQRGFTLAELMTVVGILFILLAVGAPKLITAVHLSQVRGAADGLASLVQRGRIGAERQNQTLAVYTASVANGTPGAFVDTTGNGSTWQSTDSTYVTFEGNVTNSTGSNAPTGLTNSLLGFTPASAGTVLYFNSLGLAVKSDGTQSPGLVYYLTDPTGDWAAVAVSPLGRSRIWLWNGAQWQ